MPGAPSRRKARPSGLRAWIRARATGWSSTSCSPPGSQAIPVVSNGGVTVTGCGTIAGTRISSVLYYNASGELVSSLSVDTLYTLVVDLRAGQDGAYSLSLTAEATAYLANAVVARTSII